MKILIIEDDKKIASFLKKSFIEEYFFVDVAHNSKDALYLGSTNSYDIIILDVMLGSDSGYDICKKLRLEKLTTPIIVLSAKSSIEDKVMFLNLGANDYLTKPFSFDELLARVNVQLRANKVSSNILEVANLKLDIGSKKVFRDNQEIILNAKEYALLEYLIMNKNRVIDKETLLESITTYDSSISSNLIDVYIYRLRNKIDKKYTPKLLQTFKNQGYRLGEKY